MNGSWRALLAGLLLASCTTRTPRIPFPQVERWMLFAAGSQRESDDRYVHGYVPWGIEFVTEPPGSSNWAWEVGFRWGEDDGKDEESKTLRGSVNGQNVRYTTLVDVERESEIWEISVGVRQTYLRHLPVQPYFGVGGSYMRRNNTDDLQDSVLVPSPPIPDPPGPPGLDVPLQDEHSHDNILGIYMRTGLLWRMFGDPDEDRLKSFLSTDLRGFLGHEFNYVELNFGLGIGR